MVSSEFLSSTRVWDASYNALLEDDELTKVLPPNPSRPLPTRADLPPEPPTSPKLLQHRLHGGADAIENKPTGIQISCSDLELLRLFFQTDVEYIDPQFWLHESPEPKAPTLPSGGLLREMYLGDQLHAAWAFAAQFFVAQMMAQNYNLPIHPRYLRLFTSRAEEKVLLDQIYAQTIGDDHTPKWNFIKDEWQHPETTPTQNTWLVENSMRYWARGQDFSVDAKTCHHPVFIEDGHFFRSGFREHIWDEASRSLPHFYDLLQQQPAADSPNPLSIETQNAIVETPAILYLTNSSFPDHTPLQIFTQPDQVSFLNAPYVIDHKTSRKPIHKGDLDAFGQAQVFLNTLAGCLMANKHLTKKIRSQHLKKIPFFHLDLADESLVWKILSGAKMEYQQLKWDGYRYTPYLQDVTLDEDEVALSIYGLRSLMQLFSDSSGNYRKNRFKAFRKRHREYHTGITPQSRPFIV